MFHFVTFQTSAWIHVLFKFASLLIMSTNSQSIRILTTYFSWLPPFRLMSVPFTHLVSFNGFKLFSMDVPGSSWKTCFITVWDKAQSRLDMFYYFHRLYSKHCKRNNQIISENLNPFIISAIYARNTLAYYTIYIYICMNESLDS